jgi:hypothetical protein
MATAFGVVVVRAGAALQPEVTGSIRLRSIGDGLRD